MASLIRIPREYCSHAYECVHFDGRYQCKHCGDICYHGVNGADVTHLKVEDMVRELTARTEPEGGNNE